MIYGRLWAWRWHTLGFVMNFVAWKSPDTGGVPEGFRKGFQESPPENRNGSYMILPCNFGRFKIDSISICSTCSLKKEWLVYVMENPTQIDDWRVPLF